MYSKIVIGIDQSYTRTGISIVADGNLVKVTSMPFRGCTIKSEKRKYLSNILNKLLTKLGPRTSQLIIICERIRTFSHNAVVEKEGKPKPNNMFISTDYIKATGALIATIVDVAYEHNVPVYSVDTRSWKAQVVGNTKKQKGNKKLVTINFMLKNYPEFSNSIKSVNKKGTVVYNDDAADSACIALYGFISKTKQALKLEQ